MGTERTKENYAKFLESQEWKECRDLVIKRAGGVCEACLKRAATEVHHLSYSWGWLPPLWMLRAVCDECHLEITNISEQLREGVQIDIGSTEWPWGPNSYGSHTPEPQEWDTYEPLEVALCAILWKNDERRRSCRPEEILPLIADSRVKELVLAIISESPEELEVKWRSMDNRFPLAFIAKGDSFCEELELVHDADPWGVVCERLKRKRAKERMDYLDARMKRQEATLEEMNEFVAIAQSLKNPKFPD